MADKIEYYYAKISKIINMKLKLNVSLALMFSKELIVLNSN